MTAPKTSPGSPWVAPRPLFIALLLIAITFILYVPSAGFEYINCDDPDYITDNPDVLGGLTWHGIYWAFSAPHAGNWIPLAWMSHMVDVSLYGLDAGGPHLENALIHAVNAALVFLLFLRWTGGLWRSAFVGALFAWHPLRVESVAWVCERRDVMCAFFMLLALLAYTRYARESKVQSPKSKAQNPKVWYGWVLVLFVCALMSKPMAVTLPLMLVLMDFWPLERGAWGGGQGAGKATASSRAEGQKSEARNFWGLIWEKAPFFALSGIFSVLTVSGQNAAGAVFSVQSLPVLARLEDAAVSYARYVGKILWPANLGMPYPLEVWPVSLAVVSFGFILGVSVWAACQMRRRPYVTMGWFWFLATLLPVIGLIQAGSQAIADRFVYLPCLGLFLIIVQGAEELWPPSVTGRWLKGAAAAVILSVCAWRSEVQLGYWQNSGTMFGHTLAVTGANPFASQDYGCYLRDHGHLDEAIEQFRAALEVSPKDGNLLTDLAYAVGIRKREYAEAVPMYEAALQAKPDEWDIHNDFATILDHLGRTDEMMRQYQEVLRLKPDDAMVHDRLGIALAGKGELDEAIGHFREALRLEPDSIGAHCNLGNALTVQKQYAGAIQQYEAALRLDPHYAFAENNLGSALEFSGRLPEAAEHYQKAARLDPQYATAHFNLGCLLAKTGRLPEAEAQFKETLRLQPDYPGAAEKLAGLKSAR